jgi:hypothetical protein
MSDIRARNQPNRKAVWARIGVGSSSSSSSSTAYHLSIDHRPGSVRRLPGWTVTNRCCRDARAYPGCRRRHLCVAVAPPSSSRPSACHHRCYGLRSHPLFYLSHPCHLSARRHYLCCTAHVETRPRARASANHDAHQTPTQPRGGRGAAHRAPHCTQRAGELRYSALRSAGCAPPSLGDGTSPHPAHGRHTAACHHHQQQHVTAHRDDHYSPRRSAAVPAIPPLSLPIPAPPA